MFVKSLGVWAATLYLAQAQENLKQEERIFLTNSYAEAGHVIYIEMYEHQNASHLQKLGDWSPLITGLKYPTFTTYDINNQLFYVCDCDEILQYSIEFGETKISATYEGPIVQGVYCGGMAIDKFENLFYVDTVHKSTISKVNRDLLQLQVRPVAVTTPLYSGDESKAAASVQDIDIEHEYLYWASDSSLFGNGHGGVHKAFTEPFIKAEPFQTYEIEDVAKASAITTNENFLFFTGQKTVAMSQPESQIQLFIQKKQGAGLYYHFGEEQTERLRKPGALLTYKDTLLLIANEGFISMLDMAKFPPFATDFKEHTIAVPEQWNVGSNSICAAVPAQTKASKGMSFITMERANIDQKTISYSGATQIGIASIVALGASLILAF